MVILASIGSSDTSSTSTTNTKASYKEPRLSKRDIKKMRKAQRRAEMDAYEDMLMYLEVFSDYLREKEGV